MGCAGSSAKKETKVEAAADLLPEAEVQFIWPSAESKGIVLEVRGTSPEARLLPWQQVEYKGPASTFVTLPTGPYVSRWVMADGKTKKLTPTEEAPSLMAEVRKVPKVQEEMNKPENKKKIDENLEKKGISDVNKMEIEDLPTDDAKMAQLVEALKIVEGALPSNAFSVTGQATLRRGGKIVAGKPKLSIKETVIAKALGKWEEKSSQEQLDTLIQVKDKGITAAESGLKSKGYSLSELVGGDPRVKMGVTLTEEQKTAKLAEMEKAKVGLEEPLSEEELKSCQTDTPTFSSPVIARYCLAKEGSTVPVRFEWIEEDADVSVRYWKHVDPPKAAPAAAGDAEEDKKAEEDTKEEVKIHTPDEKDVTEVKMAKRVPRPLPFKKKLKLRLPGAPAEEEKLTEEEAKAEEEHKKKEEERCAEEAKTIVGVETVIQLPPGAYGYQFVKDGTPFISASEEANAEQGPYSSFQILDVSVVQFQLRPKIPGE